MFILNKKKSTTNLLFIILSDMLQSVFYFCSILSSKRGKNTNEERDIKFKSF